MITEFIHSPAGDFVRSPAEERGGNLLCSRVGFVIGTNTYQNFNLAPSFQNRVGVFNLGALPSTSEGQTFPKQDYWKFRVSINVTTPWPAIGDGIQPFLSMALMSWNAQSGARTMNYNSIDSFEFYQTLAASWGMIHYYDDGLDFLTAERPARFPNNGQYVPSRILMPNGYPVTYPSKNQNPYTFSFPNAVGNYTYTFKIPSRGFCNTWFYLTFCDILGPNKISGQAGLPWAVEQEVRTSSSVNIVINSTILRVFAMIVSYQTNIIAAAVGQNIQFTDRTETDNIKTAFLWTFGDGTTSTLQNPVKSYSTPGTYQVTLRITDSSEEQYTTFGREIKTITVS